MIQLNKGFFFKIIEVMALIIGAGFITDLNNILKKFYLQYTKFKFKSVFTFVIVSLSLVFLVSIVPFGAQAADDSNFTNRADVSVVVTDSPDPVYQGQNITYDIVVKNNSPDTAANGVVVTDTICPNAYFVSASGAPYTAYANDIIFQVGTLSPGQALVIKMVTKVSGTAATDNIPSTNPDIGTAGPKPEVFDMCNMAKITATTGDSNTANNSYYQMTNVLPAVNSNPSYKIDKTVVDVAGQGPLGNVTTFGDVITYQIKVSNNGDVNLTNVTLTDSLITLTGPAESVNADGVLQVGEKWEYTGRYTATQQDISTNGGGNQLIENTATVDCDQLAPKSDFAEVPFRGLKAFIVDKTVLDVAGQGPSGNISAAGEIIQYQIRVTNVGNADLMNINANDSLVSLEKPEESLNANGILEIGETWVYTAYYTVTQEDISTNGGGDQIIENTATIVCDELGPKTATTEVPLKGLPAYIIQKNVMDVAEKGPKGTATRAGNIITYEIIVRNVGNIGLTNITVSDSLLGVLKNHTESVSDNEIMEDEETWTYTGFYNVTSEDIRTNGGGDKLINNIATVNCDQLPAKFDNADAPVGSPSYILDKLVTDVAGRGPAGNVTQVGDVINYLITIRNTGNVNLARIAINDSLTNLTGPVESKIADGILNKQENWNYTGNYTVTQDDINTNGGGNKLIENKVTVVCEELDPRSKSDTVEVPLEVPSYIIDKSVFDIAGNGPTGNISKAGDKISYKICVRNVGTIDLTNISVKDSLISLTGPNELLSANGVLNVGENWTYTGNYTVTQQDLNTNGEGNQLIENTATADCDQLEPKSDIAEVPIKGAPAYIIEKTVTDVAGKGPSEKLRRAGDRINYQIVINNTGNIDLTNLTLSDPLISLSSPVESQNAGRVLEVGENWVYTGTYNITQEDINNNGKGKGLINNTATVDCYQLDAMQDSAEVLIERNPACTVNKTVTDVVGKGQTGTITTAGDIASYRISVNNTGNVDLTNVTVSDSLIKLTAPLESLNINGILEVGEIWTYNSSYNVTQTDINNNGNANGSLENTVTVSSDQLGPITDKANVPILRLPDYNINKTAIDIAGKGPAAEVTKAGEIVSYFIALNNTGNVELTNVSVVDSLISLTGPVESKTPDRILEVGETWNYTGNYTVTQIDLNNNGTRNGIIENKATADCDQLEPLFDTAAVPLSREPDYTLDKAVIDVAGKGPAGNAAKAGDIIEYSVLVNNTGNVELTNVSLTDSLIKLMGPIESGNNNGILEVGEKWNYTGNYTVTQEDLNNNFGGSKSIKNTAIIDCDQLDPESDFAEVKLEILPACTIDKRISDVAGRGADGLIRKAGDVISYQINVSNKGNIDLTNTSVTDSLINLTAPDESKTANGILEVGENWSYAATYKVTQRNLNNNGNKNGSIENTATVDSDQLEPQNDSATAFLERKLGYSLNKTVKDVGGKGPEGIVREAGQVIAYQVKVENSGNVDLTNITISDLLTNLSGPLESKNPDKILEVEENWTYTGNYTATQADLNSNGNGNEKIENTATVDCAQLDPLVSSAEVLIERNPACTIEKSVINVAGKGPAANVTKAGERISYSIIVNNTGNVDLTNVSTEDSLINLSVPFESKIANGILEVGEAWNYTGDYIVSQADMNTNADGHGFINNTATVDSDQLEPQNDSAGVPLLRLPDYTLDKTVIDVAGKGQQGAVTKAGERISYSIIVNNTGNIDLTNVTVVDSLINLTGPVESKNPDGILEADEIWNYTGSYTATQKDINGNGDGFIDNTATVDCEQLDPKTDTAKVPVTSLPGYSIDKTITDVAGKGPGANVTRAGEKISYSIFVNNTGNVELTNITIDDSLTDLAEPLESLNKDRILEVGETWICTGNYTVTQENINTNNDGKGFIENTASVDCDQLDPKSDNATVLLKQLPDYFINKTVIDIGGRGAAANITAAGDIIYYQVNVSNSGNLDLTNVTVIDSLITLTGPGESKNSDLVLEVGEFWTFSGNYSVSQADLNLNGNGNAGGFIENIATVDSDQLEPRSSTAKVPIQQLPAYTIDKNVTDVAGKGSTANITKAGEIIGYLVSLKNTGNLDLTNVTVSDSLISLTEPVESKTPDRILEVGEIWSYTGSYTATQTDVNTNGNGNGLIENTATVDCDELDPKSDIAEISINQTPDYLIDKTITDVAGKGPTANITKAGDLVIYRINVTNSGNIDLTNVNVTDSLINLTGPTESKTPDRILEVGENWIFTGNYSVTQADINSNGNGNGRIENTATVDCDRLDPKSDKENVSITQSPEYMVTKLVMDVAGKGPEANVTKAGERISYSIIVNNTGNTELTNVSAFDSLINLTGPKESKIANRVLEVGENWAYNGNYSVTQTDMNSNGDGNGKIENVVKVDCDQLEEKSDTAEVPLKSMPDYNIDKIVTDVAGHGSSGDITKAGNTVNYQINVSNTGNLDLTNITVSDSLISLTSPIESLTTNGILEVGEIWSYTGTYTATQADINSNGGGNGFIENKATVDCDQLDPKSDEENVSITRDAGYTIEKMITDIAGKGPTANITRADDVLTYQINVTNTGNVDLTNVTLTDSLIDLAEPLESLNVDGILGAGETWLFNGNYTVKQMDINTNGAGNGKIENTATVDCDQLDPKSDSANASIELLPDYVIDKIVIDVAGKGASANVTKAGDLITYRININNNGNSDLTNVTVTDSLVNLTRYVESKTTNGILEVGENWTYNASYIVKQADINSNGNGDGLIENIVTVDCDQLEPESDNESVALAQNADYIIEKTVIDVAENGPTANITKAGDLVTYQINVSNTGNTELTNINITDSLIKLNGPAESANADRVLEVGEVWIYTGTYTVTQTDINSRGNGDGVINNTATVDCDQLDPKTDDAQVQIDNKPAYSIEKKVLDIAGKGQSANITKTGEIIGYSAVVHNEGNVDLTNVTVQDSLIKLIGPFESKTTDKILEVGENWTYNGNYSVTQQDINTNGNGSGLINNIVTVDSDQLEPERDNESVPLTPNVQYTIDKTIIDVAGKGQNEAVTKAGDLVSYLINVNNTGNVDLANLNVTDSLIKLIGPIESQSPNRVLQAGESWTYIGTYSATQRDINTNGGGDGFINNTATVESDLLDPKSDSEAVSVLQNPNYTIDKKVTDIAGKGQQGIVTKAGEIIGYSVLVSNTGNTDLTNVTVNDSLISLTEPVESKTPDRILEVGETWNYTGNYTVTQADINSDRNGNGNNLIENTATVDCDQLGPKSDIAQAPLKGVPAYTIDKAVRDVAGKGSTGNITASGEIINYSVNITNTGDLDLTNVNVTDSLIPLAGPIESKAADRILEVGESWNYDGNYTVTQADINTRGNGSGSIRNIATVDCDQLNPISDSKNVSITQSPECTVEKIVTDVAGKGPQGFVTKAGEKIGYSIVIKNTGNTDLTNVTAFDSLINIKGPVESKTTDKILEVGEIWNYSGNYIVTQADINNNGNHNGSIENKVTIDCDQLGPKSDIAAVLLKGAPDYIIEKSVIDVSGKGPKANVTAAGDIITYQVKVTNDGNIDLTNLTVNDSLISLKTPFESLNADKVLEVGENWTYTGNYSVTQVDINTNGTENSLIENIVTVDCDQLDPKNDSAVVPIKKNPALNIEKEVTDVGGKGPSANVTAAGEIINYRINVTNSGNIDFTNVTVSDSLIKLNRPVESVNSDGILQAGESWIYTGNYTVAQEDINSNGNGDGFIDNTATVDCDQMEPRTDTAKVPVTGLPNYNIEKTVLDVAGKGPKANITKAGERISYSILVNNTGNSDLTNVNITDSLITLSELTESKTANKILEVGEFWSYTGNYTVTQTDINNNGKGNGQGNGLISNTATVDCAQLEPESDTAEVALKAAAGYNINKTVMDVSGKGPLGNVTKAGDVIKYQIGVTNSGNSDLTNITVIDSLINLTGPTESKTANGILEVEETWNYTGSYIVTQEDINTNGNETGFVKNTATVDCDQLGPKSDNKTVPITQNPDYAIDKTVLDVSGRGPSGNIRKAGDVVNYSVIINNTGNSDLTNVTVTDSLISLIGPWESVNKNGILEVGETWSYTGNLTLTQKDINMMLEGYVGIYNRATVDCDQLNPESDGVNVPVLTNPDYTIDKKVLDIAGRGPAANVTKAGEVISYSVIVNNTGNIDLTNAKIVDSLTELTGPVESKTNDKILEVEETWTYTGNYTVTQADLNSNESGKKLIENNATVDCDQLDPKSDKVQTPINASPAYNVNKTVVDVAGKSSSANITSAGDKIVYLVNVTNTGNSDLTNVTVTDSLINLTGPIESKNSDRILETEEIWTYNGNYTATQVDINSNGNGHGLIENIVTVDSDQLGPKSDSKNVSIAQNARYTIEKIPTNVAGRGPAANITKAGEIISYRVSVNNTGNIDLTNVTVADTLINLSGPIESKTGNRVLEVGEIWNYIGNYTVKQADINTNGGGDGFIDNTATVKSDQLKEKSDTAKVPLSGTADFTINKKVTDIAGKGPFARVTKAGEKIIYQVIVTNSGNIDLTNVSVTDSLINLTSPDESLTADGILEVGENWTYEGNYTVTQADINTNGGGNGFIENTATVSCDQLTPKSDSEDVSLSRKLDYSIDKIVVDVGGKGPIGKATKAGEKITYSIIVTNEGNANLANVTVVDSLTNLGEPLESWTKNKILEVGEFWIFESKYTVTQNDINTNGNGDGFIENTVQVSCDKLEPKSKTAKVPVKNSPAYTIDKKIVNIAGKGLRSNITKAGEVIEYSVIVNNTGNVELTNTTVFDSLTTLGGPIESQNSDRVLEVGESWNYNGNYTVTQLDINSNGSETGFIKNTATVDSDQLDPKTDEADVPIAQSAACTIDKKAVNIAGKGSSGNVTKAGDIISYQINVSNTGNTELTNITVSDSLISLKGPVESLNANEILESGENWTYTGNYTVTQQDINSNGEGDGFIENTAAVRSDQLKEISVTVKVPLEPISVCLVDKTVVDVAGKGPTGNVTAAGDVISYQVNVTNTGNIDLTNITISDSLAELTGPIESKNPDRILETEEIWTYTGNYTVNQADINNNGNRNGFIENIVTVDSDQLEPKTDNETVPVSYKPAYSINKKATDVAGKGKTGNVTKAGEIISYQINVINEGNIELTNITVIDPLITLTRPLESLNADEILEIGEIWTYSGNYTTTQKDLDNNGNGKGFIENIATVDCDQLEPKTDTETVPITQNFSYLIEKRVAQIDAKGNKVIDSADDTIGYEIEIINQGNINLTNVTVTDSLISLTAPRESKTADLILEIGESWIYTGTYTVNQADIDSNGEGDGLIENLATVSCDQLAPKSNEAKVPIIQDPALNIDKSASPENYSTVGQIITYTYNITNIGNMNVTPPITVTDNKIGTINVTGRSLIPGQSVLVNTTYRITQADLDAGSITNSAYATGNLRNNTTTSNTDSETVTSIQNPGLRIDKSASPSNYSSVGDLITYTYNVTNKGNVNITGPIKITDNRTGPINVTGNLMPGQSVQINNTYSITQADIDSGSITNSAFATGKFGNNTIASNTDNETVISEQKPALLINKSADPAIYSAVGDIITYTYKISNIGNVNITGPVTVIDNKIGTIQATNENLRPGQNILANATYIITQTDIDAGFVTNSALATGIFGNNTTTSNTDNETVTSTQNPKLEVEKSGFPTNYSFVGQIITYRYNITNTGNVIIAGPIEVTDNKTGTIIVTAGNLIPGQTIIKAANYTITQEDLNAGSVTNSAFATGTFGNNTTISNTDNETVTGDYIPALLINKTADPKTYDSAGDLITYTYNITNIGNVNITGPITVIDDKIGTVSIADGNLVPGQSMFANATYIITQADLDRGFITNSAYAASTSRNKKTTSNTDNKTVTAIQNGSYEIKKIVTDAAGKGPSGNVAKAGDVISYQIDVTNNGNINLTNINVADALFENLTEAVKSLNTNEVLEVGETWTYTGNYTVTQQDIDTNGEGDGVIDNIATVKSDQLDPKSDNVQVSIENKPGYIIDKIVTDVAGKGPDAKVTAAGESITYQINVTNTGNINLTNISFNDTLITIPDLRESKNSNRILEVGEIWTYTGNYTVIQEDLNSNGNGTGFIKNDATVNCDQLKPRNDSAFVQINQNLVHIIEKTVIDVAGKGPEGNITAAGDIIRYRVNISNTGNVDFTNVTVADSLINLDGPAESLSSDRILQVTENWTYTGNYTVTQEDINSNGNGTGLINNTVTVDCDQAEPSSDDAQVPIQNEPGYVLDKIVTDVAGNGPFANVTKAGEIISYQITVKNTGNVNLTNVILSDPLIAILDPIESLNINRVLEVGENWVYTGNYTVTQADIETNGEGDRFIENTATVDCDQLEPVSDSVQVTIEKQQKKKPGYIIEKTVTDVAGKGSDGKVTKPGDLIVYQINVTNTGNVNLTNITLEDPLITVSGPVESLDINGVLEIGETWIYTGTYTVTQADIDSNGDGNGFINNTATVDCDQLEPNSDSEAVEIARKIKLPDYLIQKSIIGVDEAGDGIINAPGDIIEYQVIVKNTGEVNLTNVSVVDSLITLTDPRESINADMVLEIGETWILTGNYTVTQADINSNGGGDGFIDNTARVSCNELPIKSSTARQPILYKPAYNIYKSIVGIDEAGDCIINKPGDIIEYIIAVKNEGNVDLTDISVQDTLITSLTGPIGDDIDPGVLNPGETWKYTGIYTVTEEDINSNGNGDGFIENTAIVSSKELPEKSSVAAQPIIQKTDLCIYKCISGADKARDCVINKPGEIIEYEIVVKNSGRTDLTGVLVNDPMLTLTGPTGDNIMPGILNPGEVWKYTGIYTVTQEDINSNGDGDGFIENTVTVHTNEAPEEKSSARQAISQKSDYCIYKSVTKIDEAGDCIINKPGDKIEYCVAVKNEGNSDLTGILIKDTLITSLTGPIGDDLDPGVLDPEETWKYSGTYTVTEQDIKTNGNGDGFIENTATVSCNELSPRDSTIKQSIVSQSSETGTDSNPIIIPGNEKDKDSNPDSSTGGNNNNGKGKEENGGGSSGGSSRKSSAGTSSGGGAGGSPEPAKNVETKEIAQVFVTNGKAVKFEFINNATCVIYVSFDAKKTAGKVTTIVEMLKGKSALVPELPAGETYKSFNVWVGNEGFATAKNIDNAVICFRVEKAWVEENKINKSTIILNRYNKQWEQLLTSPSGEDDKFLYFVAKTSEFGSFAITAEKNQISDSNIKNNEPDSGVTREVPQERAITGSANRETSNTSSDAKKEQKSISGFELLYGVAGLSAVFLYKRK